MSSYQDINSQLNASKDEKSSQKLHKTMPTSDANTDQRKLTLEGNPCPMCRALRLPLCRGHGGDASGTNENQDWEHTEDTDLIFAFKNPLALFSITLDIESGSLMFQGNQELSKEQQKKIDELFQAIKNELTHFKNELSTKLAVPISLTCNQHTLSIKISEPSYFDLFIQRLTDKNLLPNKLIFSQEQKNYIEQQSTPLNSDLSIQGNKSTTPTPFDINGPRPKR